MRKLTEPQARSLRALGLLLLEVPAAKRAVLNNEIRSLLEAFGLVYEEHLYLLGERFRARLPGSELLTANTRRQYYFEVLAGSAEEDPDLPYEWHGFASVEEIAYVLGRTTKTITNWLTDKRRRSHRYDWVLASVPVRYSGNRTYLMRYQKLNNGAPVPELSDGMTIMDAFDEVTRRTEFKRYSPPAKY